MAPRPWAGPPSTNPTSMPAPCCTTWTWTACGTSWWPRTMGRSWPSKTRCEGGGGGMRSAATARQERLRIPVYRAACQHGERRCTAPHEPAHTQLSCSAPLVAHRPPAPPPPGRAQGEQLEQAKLVVPRLKVRRKWFVGLAPDPTDHSHLDVGATQVRAGWRQLSTGSRVSRLPARSLAKRPGCQQSAQCHASPTAAGRQQPIREKCARRGWLEGR